MSPQFGYLGSSFHAKTVDSFESFMKAFSNWAEAIADHSSTMVGYVVSEIAWHLEGLARFPAVPDRAALLQVALVKAHWQEIDLVCAQRWSGLRLGNLLLGLPQMLVVPKRARNVSVTLASNMFLSTYFLASPLTWYSHVAIRRFSCWGQLCFGNVLIVSFGSANG